MPNIFLLCSEEDARKLVPYVEIIGLHLRCATAIELNLKGPHEVAFRIVSFIAGSNVGRFEISVVASQTLERLINLIKLRDSLAKEWHDLTSHPKLSAIADIFEGEVEVWPQMPIGKWGSFEEGQLLNE